MFIVLGFKSLLSNLFLHFVSFFLFVSSNLFSFGCLESVAIFTITAEIHVHSLVNFYCQYVDRHMNLKFIPHVSEREWVIRQFVIVKNKMMSVFNVSVLLLIMNFVITLSKYRLMDPQLL